MEPSLFPGEYLIATNRGRIRRGSLVVVERPDVAGLELIKRVAGIPGDLIGGRLLEDGEHWVVGERTEASTDSRSFGPVAASLIRGVVRIRYWPPSRISLFRRAG